VSISTVQLKILGKKNEKSKMKICFLFNIGVNAQVQLAVKFDKIVDIVNKTLESLDLNPLLARTISGVQNTVNNLV
jgi:hypothetical protein